MRQFVLTLKRALRVLARFTRAHRHSLPWWGATAFLVLGGVGLLWAASLRIPDLSTIAERKVEQSLKLYDRTGTVLLYDVHEDKQRTVVPIEQVSPDLQHATIAIEDPNFYQHRGIELRAIARATLANFISLGISQGGSTITQQVVKRSVLTGDKTLTRKLKEWILSLKLEAVLPKEKILELYLNEAPYGGSIYGVEEASQTFFGKHASDVSLPEAAYLAAVLPAPTYYSPYGNNKEKLDERKDLVLQKMLEHGYITEEQFKKARVARAPFLPPRGKSLAAPHFIFYVRQQLEEKYGEAALEENGWRIITTLDADLQEKAEEVVLRHALENEKNFNASNAGLLALDPTNGNILAMVGSRDYFDTKIGGAYNVTLAKRQPGSAFKPFAYAQAFIKGYTPSTALFNVRTQFQTTCSPYDLTSESDCFSPQNYDLTYTGPVTMREALAQSINVASVKVLYLAGLGDTLQLAKIMGISTLQDPGRYGLTLVLGGGEVTLLDITSAYGVFATDGVRNPPLAILRIEDAHGTIIEEAQPQGIQILRPDIAQKINDVLSDNAARAPAFGENSPLYFGGRDVAVKTGTTDNYRDAWIIGYTPNLSVGAWAGNNDNTPMQKKIAAFIVAPLWNEFMRYALSKTPDKSFTRAEYDESTLKPVLRGVWQTPGIDGAVHDILYWVDKNNPQGPPPANPAEDPQFRLWEPPVQQWAAAHGYPSAPSP